MPDKKLQQCNACGTIIQPGWASCRTCTVRDRVGAEFFECDCGTTVRIEQSVRVMRKDTRKIERVCTTCATEGACRAGQHVIQTPQKKDWDERWWTFNPVPESFPRGFCSACQQQLYYDGHRWTRMDWVVLAGAWEAADA